MSTVARESEARAADVAFQVALAQIGVGTIEDALALWRGLDPTDIAATTEGWLNRAINLILGRRRMSRDLAMAYYRLARALRTGKTIADPFHPEPAYVTLGDLRREFRDLVAEIDWLHQPANDAAQSAATEAEVDLRDEPAAPTEPEPEPADELELAEDDDDRILLEEIERLREEELRLEQAAEDAARADLEALGPALLKAKVEDLDPEDTLREAEAKIADEHRKAGARVAGTSERIVLNGGRGSVYAYGQKDKRVIGWARISLSGDPCSFCAMLISRGFDRKYTSKASATNGPGVTIRDGQALDAYHDNCRCVAIPIYSEAQYDSDPRFDQNRALDALWKERMTETSGKAALNEWRRIIDGGRRTGEAHWIVNATDSPYATASAPTSPPALEAG